MKTLIYRGFGMDNDASISFNLEISKDNFSHPVSLVVKTSDQIFRFMGEESDGTGRFLCSSNIFYEGKEIDHYNVCYENCAGFFDDDWEIDEGKNFEVFSQKFKSIPEAIVWVKNEIAERREYWKNRRGQYNRLVAELRELKIDDFLDENSDCEITFSQTVKIKK